MEMSKAVALDWVRKEYNTEHEVMTEIIKGTRSPCFACIGCEVEDAKIKICPNFILSENKLRVIRAED